MRIIAATVILAALSLGIGNRRLGVGSAAAAQASGPRLMVVIVIDQFRADYLERYKHRWRSGFRVMLDEGAQFTRAAYPYLNTATCAGHVTIGTGALPRNHGVILNRWWHRAEGRAYNCMDDEATPHVSYGAAAQFGSSAKRMVVPTLADELRAQRPGSRVVALSLKSRSAIGLAGHGGDVVTWFDDGARSFVTSRAFASEPLANVRAFLKRDPPEGDLGKVLALQDRGEN